MAQISCAHRRRRAVRANGVTNAFEPARQPTYSLRVARPADVADLFRRAPCHSRHNAVSAARALVRAPVTLWPDNSLSIGGLGDSRAVRAPREGSGPGALPSWPRCILAKASLPNRIRFMPAGSPALVDTLYPCPRIGLHLRVVAGNGLQRIRAPPWRRSLRRCRGRPLGAVYERKLRSGRRVAHRQRIAACRAASATFRNDDRTSSTLRQGPRPALAHTQR